MLEDFLNKRLYIKVTKDDIPYLKNLQDFVVIKFSSGNNIYGPYIERHLNENRAIYLYVDHGIRFTEYEQPWYVTVTEILSEKINIDENEIMNLVTENV